MKERKRHRGDLCWSISLGDTIIFILTGLQREQERHRMLSPCKKIEKRDQRLTGIDVLRRTDPSQQRCSRSREDARMGSQREDPISFTRC